MATGNSVTLVGNATKDPELRFTKSGAAVAQFGLAVERRWLNTKTNDWEKETGFYDVTVWNDYAEHVAESVQKGQRVIVFGRLDYRTWETDEGDKRSKIEVTAEEVGPSLKWATADVTKIESDGGGSNKSKGSAGDPGPVEPPDEEPF